MLCQMELVMSFQGQHGRFQGISEDYITNAETGDIFLMKTKQLTNVFCSLLIALMVWPIIHMFLVDKYDISPWKLFGFAMYTTAHKIEVEVRVEGSKDKQSATASRASDNMMSQYNDFFNKRYILGKFHRPDEFCTNILESNKAFEKVTITIDTIRLEGKTGMLTSTAQTYHYQLPPPEPR